MKENTYYLYDIDPVKLYGVNNAKLEIVKKKFASLKFNFRGDKIKVSGLEAEIESFEKVYNLIIEHIERFDDISIQDIQKMLENNYNINFHKDSSDLPKNVILHGVNGNIIKAKTQNQLKMLDSSLVNDILFAIGPAGTGKTYTAVAIAVKAWKEKKIKKIILTRPAVEAGESLGFLPGDLREKVDPYLRPLYDALEDMIPLDKLNMLKENRIIEVAPLAFMRGRTLDNAYIILDEAQNCTSSQLKMFLTRIGPNAKCIVTGDISQIDLPKSQKSGLPFALNHLKDISGIDILYLDKSDVIRHRLVAKIIEAYENNNEHA
ncbi:MAG: PhoH family protein [Chitinophagales bacterium]|jgi:phosphate starvation-inducible PhoH-like protein|nr:PhoH family protein [Chitinophagales bacterium]